MTKPKRYKCYSAEFKREALRRAAEERMTDKAVCEVLALTTAFSSTRRTLHFGRMSQLQMGWTAPAPPASRCAIMQLS